VAALSVVYFGSLAICGGCVYAIWRVKLWKL